jgi:membrane protein DedA with SNARE-associated domain
LITELETLTLTTIQTIYDAWGWFGVAVLLIFENATSLTSSEIILGLAGWMLISKHDLPVSVIFVGGLYAAFGSALGASITYWAARIGGRPLVDKLIHWARINPVHITRTEKLFSRWGTWLALIGRVIPGVRTLINIPAGLARVPFLTFFGATFIGAYIWCSALIGAGYVVGHEWTLINQYLLQYFPYLLAGGLIVIAIYFFIARRLFQFAPVKMDD